MLQINSGKLYLNGVGRKNELRGILYSNLYMVGFEEKPIITVAGTLLQAEALRSPAILIYQLTEQMDDGRKEPGVLVSHGVQPYLHDFAAIVSFILRVTCTPDVDLCSRLLSEKRTLKVSSPPSKLVRRVFDPRIWLQPQDEQTLISFVADLIGLKRKEFLAVMAAIRTYVTGLHRIADDPELAYTLLVASIESLAQDFDGHAGSWDDFEETKRRKIERALSLADPATVERVKTALVQIEHLALARRFKAFALDHVSAAYVREAGRAAPPGKLDLGNALKEAYRLRSQYVHNLKGLPGLLSTELNYSETVRIGHTTLLTLEGLARLARHIIVEFVRRQPKVETEIYDYRFERYGIIQAPLSPEYWIGRAEALGANSGKQWLDAFLQQFAGHLLAKRSMTDLTAVMDRIEELVSRITKTQRRPFLALYWCYNQIVPMEHRAKNVNKIIQRYYEEIAAPSPESLVVELLQTKPADWDLKGHSDALDQYFDQRVRKHGFRAPELFEAAMILRLAERYRVAGEFEKVRALLASAADNALSFIQLQELEATFAPNNPIDWGDILLPANTSAG